LSQFDQTHRLVLAYVYDLPFGQGRKYLNRGGIVGAVLGGWQQSGSFVAHSGIPFNIYSGSSAPTGGISGYVYANCIGDPSLSSRGTAEWFNTSAFSDPAAYHVGSCGRDIVRGPGAWGYNAAMMKNFKIPVTTHEALTLQIRADAFNFFNHPNLGLPGNTLDTTSFGVITSASAPRTLQLGAQLQF